jgi:hypothetical protein
MSNPRRLLATGADDFERRLLRSADEDAPDKGARARVVVALGVATTATATTSASAGASATGAASMVGAGSKVAAVALLKWAGVAVLAAGTTTAIVLGVRPHAMAPGATTQNVPPTRASSEPSASVPVALPEPPSVALTPVAEPAHEAQALPQPRDRNGNPTHPTRHAGAVGPLPVVTPFADEPRSALGVPPATPAASALADEVASLDAARDELRAQRPRAAIRALDTYSSRFPGGVLAPEAVVVRIEALVALGDRTQADRLGRRFLAAHPTSPLADRVRATLNL